jgi:hypothetical protein
LQIAHLRQQLAAVKGENEALRRRIADNTQDITPDQVGQVGGIGLTPAVQAAIDELESRNHALQRDNARLREESETLKGELVDSRERLLATQVQRDKLAQAVQTLAPAAAEAGLLASSSGGDVLRAHLQRISELEGENRQLKKLNK